MGARRSRPLEVGALQEFGMIRALMAVVVGLLCSSVGPAHPKQVIVRTGHPIAVVASNETERGWWLLVGEHGRWSQWDGPYSTKSSRIGNIMNWWHPANPHKVFACAEAR